MAEVCDFNYVRDAFVSLEYHNSSIGNLEYLSSYREIKYLGDIDKMVYAR